MGAEAVKNFVDVVDGEHDAADPQGVHRRFLGSVASGLGRHELRELDAAVAVGGSHHGDVALNVLEAHDAIRPLSLDARLALQLHAELREERLRSFEVLDHDEDVVHLLDRHGPSKLGEGCANRLRWRGKRGGEFRRDLRAPPTAKAGGPVPGSHYAHPGQGVDVPLNCVYRSELSPDNNRPVTDTRPVCSTIGENYLRLRVPTRPN